MIKEELLLFVEIEDRAVTIFVDWDLGTGVDEKKVKKRRMWETQVSSGTRVLYSLQCVLIYCNTRKL